MVQLGRQITEAVRVILVGAVTWLDRRSRFSLRASEYIRGRMTLRLGEDARTESQIVRNLPARQASGLFMLIRIRAGLLVKRIFIVKFTPALRHRVSFPKD